MTDKLEHITVERCIADWEQRAVPMFVPANDFGRELVRSSYAGGFGAAIALAQKLEAVPAAEREAMLKRLADEVPRFLMGMQGTEGLPRA